jgi:hypothetical protein
LRTCCGLQQEREAAGEGGSDERTRHGSTIARLAIEHAHKARYRYGVKNHLHVRRCAIQIACGLVAGLGLAGCAASVHSETPASSEPSRGDPDAAPSLAVLPDAVQNVASDTERVHQGMMMARQVFAKLMPSPPADRSYASLQAWVEEQVAPWVEQRRDSVDETRFQFALGEQSRPADAVVAHAVLGLLHEDTALALSSIPSPTELDTEPEVAAMFRDLIRGQAQPFVNAARSEFADCANTGYRLGDDLRRWAEFCHARFDRLAPAATPAAKK